MEVKQEDDIELNKHEDTAYSDERTSHEIDLNVADIAVNIKSSSSDRHKTVNCLMCFRKMTSDKLKSHERNYHGIHHLDQDGLYQEIKKRKTLHETVEERKQFISLTGFYEIILMNLLKPDLIRCCGISIREVILKI